MRARAAGPFASEEKIVRLFFDPDLATSYREVSAHLRCAAGTERALEHFALSVSDRYAAALMARDAQREPAWKAFVASLHAFLTLARARGRHGAALQSIVDENADLLELLPGADPHRLNIREFVDAEVGEFAAVPAALAAAER